MEVLVQDIQDRAKYACCAKVFFFFLVFFFLWTYKASQSMRAAQRFFSPLEWGYWNRAYKTAHHARAVQRCFFFVFFCSFICLFVCLFCPVDRAQNSCCAKKKEDLNCFSTGCLHTDDRLRAQAKEGAEDGGKGGGADGHEIMTDILGLASCDALVGTMTSQVCNV